MKKIISFLILFSLALSGCSSFSKQARTQRAYEKYLRKAGVARVKQQRRMWHFSKPQIVPAPAESDPIVSSSTGPMSVSSGGNL